MSRSYHIVGHRGLPQYYPENTLLGFIEAAKSGADAIELDVQISRDGVPMVFHDEQLQRVCSRNGNIWDFFASELAKFNCYEPERFDDKFLHANDVGIATLAEVCQALKPFNVPVFIEIKERSLAYISREKILDRVFEAAIPLENNFTIISFDYDVLNLAKEKAGIGWVLREYTDKNFQKAEQLDPDILIYDVKKMTQTQSLRKGRWRWFLYDIVDPVEAIKWFELGVDFIETWDVKALYQSP